MFLPPGKCADGRVIRNRRDRPGTALAGVAGLTDGKGGVQRARFAELIAEIQMINGTCAVVEHGLLDEPLSQRLDEKIYITLRGSGRNSDMMKSFDALGQLHHDRSPFFAVLRSEEHTSELQSLMRISYAVICLKKKTTETSYK